MRSDVPRQRRAAQDAALFRELCGASTTVETTQETASDPMIRAARAVYTRKLSEEGLEQDFNSLDTQREASEAFILSQKHEGWVCLPVM
jgi:hypothetical protein